MALIGGGEFGPGTADVERELLDLAGAERVLVVPTAAAFEHPQRLVDAATAAFRAMGADAEGLMVLGRPDSFLADVVDAAAGSRFTYLAGGSPMHLRSVLKDTPLWEAMVAAWEAGGVLAASTAAAMVVSDPMVDPRGGAFTLGLGLVRPVAVVPQVDQWSTDRLHRTLDLAGDAHDLTVLTLETAGAAVRGPDGAWRAHGGVTVYRGHTPVGLDALPRG